MRVLTFQAKRFAWQPFRKTLENVPQEAEGDESLEAVVAFLHFEKRDEGEGRARAFKKTLKHLKWLANKRSMKAMVLHSFAHLGGDTGDPELARELIEALAERLTQTGYDVKCTPFGYFCSWSIDVYGESLAKVFKEL